MFGCQPSTFTHLSMHHQKSSSDSPFQAKTGNPKNNERNKEKPLKAIKGPIPKFYQESANFHKFLTFSFCYILRINFLHWLILPSSPLIHSFSCSGYSVLGSKRDKQQEWRAAKNRTTRGKRRNQKSALGPESSCPSLHLPNSLVVFLSYSTCSLETLTLYLLKCLFHTTASWSRMSITQAA